MTYTTKHLRAIIGPIDTLIAGNDGTTQAYIDLLDFFEDDPTVSWPEICYYTELWANYLHLVGIHGLVRDPTLDYMRSCND